MPSPKSSNSMAGKANSSRQYTIKNMIIDAPFLPGGLYLVATPIGNLGDITIRALEILAASDLIACEDTRTTSRLLNRYGISRPKTSYNEHNAEKKGDELLRRLKDSETISLVSDAGTPLVSDPGFRLVQRAIEEGIAVIPVPGASAPLAALVASGLSAETFIFAGFLPTKQGARLKRLGEFAAIDATLVFFESPRRLATSLSDMATRFGSDRKAVVARELTKLHETIYRGDISALAKTFASGTPPKGEIVVVIEAAAAPQLDEVDIDRQLCRLMLEMSVGDAAAKLADRLSLSKRRLYQRALELKKEEKQGSREH